MSSSDAEGNGVQAPRNVINNNGANNFGTGAGAQNFGDGAGANHVSGGTWTVSGALGSRINVGPGAGGLNSGAAAGSVNTFSGTAFSSEYKSVGRQRIGRRTESTSSKTKDSHAVEKDKDAESDEAMKTDHDSNRANGNEGDNMLDCNINKATSKEGKSDLTKTSKKRVPNKDKMDVDKSTMSIAKAVVGSSKAVHGDESFSIPAKLSEVDDFAMKLLNALSEMNEDRDVTLERFGLAPTSDACMVGKFEVHPMLEASARHLLKTIPELTSCSKAKKMMIKDAFENLCAAMRHMEVTPFANMDENFFYLCRDAIDDAESVNFKVSKIRAHLLDLAKAYLGKGKFNMVGGDMVSNLDEQIEEPAKHVENMKKFLIEMEKLCHKLEVGLKSAKVLPESLSPEKKSLSSSEVAKLRQTCVEIAKNYGDKPDLFYP